MVWIPDGASKKEKELILEMASTDEDMIHSVMEQENLDYWEAMEWCLIHPCLLNPMEYRDLLEIHKKLVQNNQ